MDLLTRLVKEAERVRGGHGAWHPEAHATIQRELREAIPVRIQNVADYLYMDIDQEQFDWEGDFPNIAPPWPKFFMWFRATPTIRSEGKVFPNPASGAEMGYLFLAKDVGAKDARWGVNCFCFLSGPAGTLMKFVVFKVTDEGRYSPIDGRLKNERLSVLGSPLLSWPSGESVGDDYLQQHSSADLTAWMAPALLAISFCHCKNVTITTEKLADKVVAKRIRKHGWSPTETHELQIEPMRKALHDAAGTDLKRSLHIMRGHFKDYRDGRGLFGKIHGMFWWDFRLSDPSHPHQYTVKP